MALLGLLVLAWGSVWLWGLRVQSQEPLARLNEACGPLHLVSTEARPWTTPDGEPRRRQDLRFSDPSGRLVRAALSLPESGNGPWPVLLVAGGFQTDLESLSAAGRHGAWALLAYGYPGTPDAWQEGSILAKVPAIRQATAGIPGEVAGLLAWASAQPWAASIHYGGFSLGAILGPACLRVAESRGLQVGSSVLAFGGADLGLLFDRNVRVPALTRRPARFLTLALLHPLDARHHLAHLRTRTLILQATEDRFIPRPSAEAMVRLKGGPKEVRWLEGGHMNPDDAAGTGRIVALCRGWLDAEVSGGAARPTAPEDGSRAASQPSSPAGR